MQAQYGVGEQFINVTRHLAAQRSSAVCTHWGWGSPLEEEQTAVWLNFDTESNPPVMIRAAALLERWATCVHWGRAHDR